MCKKLKDELNIVRLFLNVLILVFVFASAKDAFAYDQNSNPRTGACIKDGETCTLQMEVDFNTKELIYRSYNYRLYNDDSNIVECTSSDTSVALVSYISGEVELYINQPGKTIINAELENGKKVTCTLEILPPEFYCYGFLESPSSAEQMIFRYNGEIDTIVFDRYFDLNYSSYLYDEITSFVVDSSLLGTKYKSLNSKIVTINKEGVIKPVGAGSTSVIATDTYGRSIKIPIIVYFDYLYDKEFGPADEVGDWLDIASLKYGDGYVKGKTFRSAKVTVSIKGKKYRGKASSKGKFSIKIPKYLKIGTNFTVIVEAYGKKKTKVRKIKANNPTISASVVYENSKTIKVTTKKVHKGDYVLIIVSGQKYKNTVNKDYEKKTFTIKLNKKATYGNQKLKIMVYNKYNQLINKRSNDIYYAKNIKKGYTKNQVKYTKSWGYPENINTTGDYDTWWYDDYSEYVEFYKGKVIGWGY